MRVTFNPGKVRELKEFFSQENDFLDIYVTQYVIYIISNKTEVYSHKMFEVISRENYTESKCFRVDRKEFLSLLVEGTVNIFISDKNIELTFKGTDNLSYTMIRPYQSSNIASINDKFEIMRNRDKYTGINISNLNTHMPLIRSFFAIVNIRDGIMFGKENNLFVFQRVNCENLNLYGYMLNYLLRFSNKYFGFQNYIIGEGTDSIIISRQVRTDAELDFDYIMSRKYSHRINIEVNNLCQLAKKCNIGETVLLNLNNKMGTIESDGKKFTTKIEVKDIYNVRANKEAEKLFESLDSFSLDNSSAVSLDSVDMLPSLLLPTRLFKDLLINYSKSNMTLVIKKRFIQFEVDNVVYFVIGRREI